MRRVDRAVVVLALVVAGACSRPAALGQAAPPIDAATRTAPGSTGEPGAADGRQPLAPEAGLTRVASLRPGPDEVDRALLLRLRRHADAELEVEAVVRSGDAWLVAYSYDELDAWWREVHRSGEADKIRAELRRRRLACEAAIRLPEEDEAATEDAAAAPELDFELGLENGMDERSCWDRALASLSPREGPIGGDCHALAVARVTDAAIEPLWSYTDTCVDEIESFDLIDVAGAGRPQLVLRVRDTYWGVTRLGFQEASRTERVVIFDPRGGEGAKMLDQVVNYETLVDWAWHWEGSYAHVTIAPGRSLTVIEQEWRTSEACEDDEAGWAVEDVADSYDEFSRCEVEWTVTRTAWDPATQRWSGKTAELPVPERLPLRDGELKILPAGRRTAKAARPTKGAPAEAAPGR